jgi:hypothetical protein
VGTFSAKFSRLSDIHRRKQKFPSNIWMKQINACWLKRIQILIVGTGADPGFNAQEHTNKTLTTIPFGNTCEADEVSPEVEAGVVAGLQCLQP